MPSHPSRPPSPGLHRFAWATAVATLVLICIGGMVTSKGAGMSVPDWPNTYEYNMFLFPVSQWVGGILYEHTHRLVAAGVGLLTAILAAWLWGRETAGGVRRAGWLVMAVAVGALGIRQMPVYLTLAGLAIPVSVWGIIRFARAPRELRWLGVTALAAVILQGVLGGLRVVWLADEIGVFHGLLAQSFFALVVAIALLSGPRWCQDAPATMPPGMVTVFLVATVLILVQLGLGASMRHRHAGLAVPDFPLAHGRWWPRTDADAIAGYNQQRVEVHAAREIAAADVLLHMTHRVWALGVVAAVGWAWWRSRRRLPGGHGLRRGAALWLGLVGIQFALGALTVWTNKAADIATAHVAVGSLALVTGTSLTLLACRPAMRRRAAVGGAGDSLTANPCPGAVTS